MQTSTMLKAWTNDNELAILCTDH